ncbi:MAG: DUF2214 family protein [Bauldia sp.]|nr:DUF2214 family protein [Bauldia sp.]
MTTDLILAIAHHILVFAIAGLLFAELVLVRPGMTAATATRIARLDSGFGLAAGLVLVVGFLRVFFGAKPESYYLENGWFWAKIAAFVVVGLLSARPTVRFVQWRRAAAAAIPADPPSHEVATVRRFIHVEAAVFFLVPTFAAVMARV